MTPSSGHHVAGVEVAAFDLEAFVEEDARDGLAALFVLDEIVDGTAGLRCFLGRPVRRDAVALAVGAGQRQQVVEGRRLLDPRQADDVPWTDGREEEADGGDGGDQPDVAAAEQEERGERRRPDAAPDEQQPLGREAVGVEADLDGDEVEDQRDDRRPEPPAAEEADDDAVAQELGMEDQPGAGAGGDEAEHHPAEHALGQLLGDDDLDGVDEEDRGVGEEQRDQDELADHRDGADEEVRRLEPAGLVVGGARQGREPVERREEAADRRKRDACRAACSRSRPNRTSTVWPMAKVPMRTTR